MRVLVHDYSGHPFQVQLSRELARRGHEVTHSYCAAYVSGKGHLAAEPGERITFEAIGEGVVIQKMRFRYRLLQEIRFGVQLARQVRRVKPDVVLASNVPIPTLVPFVMALLVMRTPWVLWHQDVQAIAIRSFAGNQLSRAFRGSGGRNRDRRAVVRPPCQSRGRHRRLVRACPPSLADGGTRSA